ncbi:MAG: histidine phosphatase family protein [bacterium]
MSVKTCYFLRHGETDLNREFRCQGRQDVPLNDRGREQVVEAARKLKDVKIDAIYSSPLKRAMESAEIIAKNKKMPVQMLDWLVEIDYGALEGLNAAESGERFPGILYRFQSNPVAVIFPGGESVGGVAERLCNGLGRIVTQESGTILFVTHQIISGIAKSILEDKPLNALWENKLENGGISQFDISPEHIALLGKFGRSR